MRQPGEKRVIERQTDACLTPVCHRCFRAENPNIRLQKRVPPLSSGGQPGDRASSGRRDAQQPHSRMTREW
jgi:hypothetical protein